MDTANANNFSVLTYSNGFTLWHYIYAGIKKNASKSTFYDDASYLLNDKDIIVANCQDGGAILFVSKSLKGKIKVNKL